MAKTLQHQIIEGALDILSEEKRWTRCSMARNSEGQPCSVWDPGAVRFCAVGALWRAANELTGALDAFRLVESIAKRVIAINSRTDCLQTCNDLEGHAAVVRMLQVSLGLRRV
jgi:hypothetical protein